jgi:ligand-binding SRPBCC domain-containing protein
LTKIHLTTFIAAPVDRVFDLSRSISLHKISMQDTREDAIAGKTSGVINVNETVTWEAKHLFKTRRFTSKITAMERPVSFVDEMLQGDFKNFRHEHHFKLTENGTIMIDIIAFESPYGFIGKLLNKYYLKNYFETLLTKRNNVLKEYAETDKWMLILN